MAMKASRLGYLLVVLLVTAASAAAHRTLEIRAHPHVFVADGSAVRKASAFSHYSQLKSSVYRAIDGVTIPMNGGTLTLGAFFVNITIGHSGSGSQSFPALVDTGSSNIWVTGFDPSKSETFQPLGCDSAECERCNVESGDDADCLFGPPICDRAAPYPPSCGWGITYGGGGTIEKGVYGSDKVCFAGSDICTTGAPFGHRVQSYPPGPGSIGAIIGLSFPRNACNPSCVTTLYDAILAENKNLTPGFSMCLTQGEGGVLDFGFVNKSRLAGPIQTLKVTHKHWYNLAVVDVSIEGESSGLPHYAYSATNDIIGSFVDSGTTVLGLGPLPFTSLSTSFQKKYGHLAGVKELWGGSCAPGSEVNSIIDMLPDIDVAIDPTGTYSGVTAAHFKIPPTSYLLKAGTHYCLGVAEISGVGAILGDVFLENYVALYDPIVGTVGLAPIVPGSCRL